jgi:dienelactone hydrolase
MERLLLLTVFSCSLLLSACAGSGVSIPLSAGSDVAAVRGNLVLPKERQGPVPAVVIVHGCSGPRPNGVMWAGFLAEHGYASLVLDGFGPRGVFEICTNFNRVPVSRRLQDLQAVLAYLQTRPEIAADRVAVMGFSNGAVVALDAASRFWSAQLAHGSLRYRATIALYPECRNRLIDYALPSLILIGDKDDWTLASSCEELLQRSLAEGIRPELRIYPGGLHAFDDLRSGGYLPQVRNINSTSGFGATVGGDGRSLEAAKADVLAFLRRQLD